MRDPEGIGGFVGTLTLAAWLTTIGYASAQQAQVECTKKRSWQIDPTAITTCACSDEEAKEAVLTKIRSKCETDEPTSAKLCRDRGCAGSELGDNCRVAIKGKPSIGDCKNGVAGEAGCPSNCPGSPRECRATGRSATCDCQCERAQGKRPCAGSWDIYRHITGTDLADLRSKAVTECTNAGNAIACEGRKCTVERRPNCRTIAAFTAEGRNTQIDGKITCSCDCDQ
jgi:hypothetical protein